eukprot:366318-Chlamydomonas_euryale.AAC.5
MIAAERVPRLVRHRPWRAVALVLERPVLLEAVQVALAAIARHAGGVSQDIEQGLRDGGQVSIAPPRLVGQVRPSVAAAGRLRLRDSCTLVRHSVNVWEVRQHIRWSASRCERADDAAIAPAPPKPVATWEDHQRRPALRNVLNRDVLQMPTCLVALLINADHEPFKIPQIWQLRFEDLDAAGQKSTFFIIEEHLTRGL